MRHKTIILALAATALFLLLSRPVYASTWYVSAKSGGVFKVWRLETTKAETVHYRTVSVSAMAGKHFTPQMGTLHFEVGEDTKEVTVTETPLADVELRYHYQANNNLYYDFELSDDAGNLIVTERKTIYTGGTTNNNYYLNNITDWVNKGIPYGLVSFEDNKVTEHGKSHDSPYTPPTDEVETDGTLKGYVYIDDSYDYRYKAATLSPAYLFAVNRAGGSGEWHELIGNKLFASVVFTEKEKDDGYGYIQILVGDRDTPYDEGADPNGAVNALDKCIYKACFELKYGSGVYSGNGKWVFPHGSDDKYDTSGNSSRFFWLNSSDQYSYLWQQRFKSSSYRDLVYHNNALVLSPAIPALTIRFDCGGSNDDTFGYKDLFVRWALSDNAAPTVLTDEIVIAPGIHAKGNKFSVTIPFSEPVTGNYQTNYYLNTTWGRLNAIEDCFNTNVMTFSGDITADAGTSLVINSLGMTNDPLWPSGTPNIPIRDLFDNDLSGEIYKSFSGEKVGYVYDINYEMNGGTAANPVKYSDNSKDFALVNPTREYHIFKGWSGTDINGLSKNVLIPRGSTGDRSYTANWAIDPGVWTGSGTEAKPYVIKTVEGLNQLAGMVNSGISFEGIYIELGANIDLSSGTFAGIGTASNGFNGSFDGNHYSVSNFTVNSDGQTMSGFFRYVKYGTVKNLTIVNATVNGVLNTGVIAGKIDGASVSSRSEITGCPISGSTVNGSSSSDANAGIVAGSASYANVKDCTASLCSVSCASHSNGYSYVGAVSGYLQSGYVQGNVFDRCTVTGTTDAGMRIGGLTGSTGSFANVTYNLLLDTSIGGTEIVTGYRTGVFNANNNYYHNLTLSNADHVSNIYAITAGKGVNVSPAGSIGAAGQTFYIGGEEITVSAASGYSLGAVTYTVFGGETLPATDAGNGTWTFTMPAADVTINKNWSTDITAHSATVLGKQKYITSFYDGATDYQLPEGALAYTVSLVDGVPVFYRIGEKSDVIPHGTAVVILADSATLTLSALSGTSVTARPGNILQGSDTAISKPSGSVYVLGANSLGIMAFKLFSSGTIPAGKAYYVAQ